MKALLIKDLRLMKNMKNFFVLMVGLIVAFSVFYVDISFVLMYMVVFVSTMSVSSISYDTYENGEAFLFTLPVSRKGYVKEKYVFSILLMLGAMIVFIAFSYVLGAVKQTGVPGDFKVSVFITFLVAVFFVSYMMPIQLKFGGEKRNGVILLTIGGIMFAAFAAAALVSSGAIENIVSAVKNFIEHSWGAAVCLSLLAAVICMAASYRISVRIMEKKEF